MTAAERKSIIAISAGFLILVFFLLSFIFATIWTHEKTIQSCLSNGLQWQHNSCISV